MRKHLLIYPILAGLLILLIAMPATAAQFAPAVFAIDQDVVDGTVAVTRVTTNAPGWIVIHADDGGNPGVVLGQAAVPTGISADVVVEIDTSGVTDTLWAMLHSDEGVVGEYEFPGADTPVLNNDEIVMDSFAVGEVAQSIVGIASSTEGFSTLVQAVEAAGLVETLRGDGPFTVFAPTDDAFAAVPPETLDALLADPEQLTQVLLYHVVPGAIVAADLSDGMEAETAQGDSVTITISDGNVMVNDANVTATDIMAHNGVIHVIDQVLLPPAPEEEVVEAAAADEAATEETATEEAATEDTEATEAAPEEAAAEATPTPEEETMVDEAMAETPSVTVIDQGSNGSNVAVLQAVAAQAGWMVIHADNDGAPGAVLGQTGLPAGTTDNIIVTLNEPISGETKLWAMLHVDEGEAGVYEFPGPDGPVLVDDAIVMAPFTAIVTGDEAMAAETPAAEEEAMAEETPVAEEEAMAEATPVAEEETMAEETPAEEEAMAEATPAAEEEAMADATPAAEEEAMAAPDMLPQTGFATSAATTHLPVVVVVIIALFGTAVFTRRRTH